MFAGGRPVISKLNQPIRSADHLRTVFSEAEVNYLKSQRLARVASASLRGVPEVSPVGYEFDGKFFYIGSRRNGVFAETQVH